MELSDYQNAPPNHALERMSLLLARLLAERCGLSFAVQAPRQTRGFHPAQQLAAQRGVSHIENQSKKIYNQHMKALAKTKTLDVVSIENIDRVRYFESQKISFKNKLKLATKLREYVYGSKASTGRVQRVYSTAKLGES